MTCFVKAFKHGRADGTTGMKWSEARTWAERPRCRGAYDKGFALGFTEGVIKRGRSAQGQ